MSMSVGSSLGARSYGGGNSSNVFGLNSGSQTEFSISIGNAAANGFADAVVKNVTSAGMLAARQGATRVKKLVADKLSQSDKQVGSLGDQVTFSGALTGLVDFGAAGPSASGGFQFKSGSALQDAFSLAAPGITSHGEAVDKVMVSGNTLTAGTSGKDAHDVFTLSLRPDSGLWTFTLVNPVDQLSNKSYQFRLLNLTGLMQGVKSDGATDALSGSVTIRINNDLGRATGKGNEGVVHQAGLTYSAPSTAAASGPKKYTPPINPLTGRGYAAASMATSSTLNILA